MVACRILGLCHILLRKSVASTLPFWSEVYKHIENKCGQIQCSGFTELPTEHYPMCLCFFHISVPPT